MKRNIGKVSLYVEEKGAGEPTLIFLHYWGGTHRTWSNVTDVLAKTYRTVTYDSRGWGQSDPAESGYGLSELTDDAAALIEHLGTKEYVLVGHSMGGKVAQLLASRRPAGLKGLVLVAPASPAPTRFPEQAKQQQIHAYDNRETAVQTLDFLCARMPEPSITEQIIEDCLSGASQAKLTWPMSAILEDISSDVSRINVPTIVLAGQHDRLDSIEQHRREILQRIPQARLQIISGSGHLVPVDEPLQLAGAIGDFVTQMHS